MNILPDRLRPGGLIRVVSPGYPALGIARARRRRAERALVGLGLEVDYGVNSATVTGHLAGTARARADDINAAFADDSVDAILCALGGTKSLDVIDLLDYEMIAANPKPFIGHSANVLLMMAMWTRSGLGCFHGPSFINQLGEFPAPFPEALVWFRRAVMKPGDLRFAPVGPCTNDPQAWWQDPDDEVQRERQGCGEWRWMRQGTAVGPLLGGHLFEVLESVDLPWSPDYRGSILFWDSTIMSTVIIDYALNELFGRGIIQQCAGMVVGRPYRLAPNQKCSLEDVIQKWLPVIPGPVLVNADCGHADPVWTLPYGRTASLDSKLNLFHCESGVL